MLSAKALLCVALMMMPDVAPGQETERKAGLASQIAAPSDAGNHATPVPRRTNSIAASIPLQGTIVLDPRLLVQLLVARSADIEYSRLQIDVAGNLKDAEAALYESIFFGNVRREDRERQRTAAERQASLITSNVAVLNERVNSIEAGARNRLPTGGEVSLSYRLRDTRNNIISTSVGREGEYDGALILTFKQPLLRGSGRDVIETDRRIAEIEEKISVLQYKQQLLKASNDALSVYWQFYRALEVSRIRREALENARKLQIDTLSRVEAGRVPASNVLEANAAIMVREVEMIRAEQGVREAESRLLTILNMAGRNNRNLKLDTRREFVAGKPEGPSVEQRYQLALETWPTYQIAKLKVDQGRIRLNFADNQRRPALDLVLSRSNSGLAYRRDEAQSITRSGQFPEWTVGLSLEVPLLGNQRATSQHRAQMSRIQQSLVELEATDNALANEIQTRWEQVEASYRELNLITKDVEIRSKLFENERVRYEMGLGLLAQLLQRESDLNESRQRLVESNVRLGLANEALLFADGSLLDEYGVIVKE